MVLFSIILCSGCVGYQKVQTYELVDGELVVTKQVIGKIFGTSGQKIVDKDISIEKKDAVTEVSGLIRDGVASGITLLKGQDIT